MVVFDANFLLLLLDENVSPPCDPDTKTPVEKVQERMEILMKSLDEAKTKIIIPTPALSEALIKAGAAMSEYLDILNNRSRFKISPFDQRAAVEAAVAHALAIRKGDKREGLSATWAKIKFDRQIISIAKVEGAKTIYSDDGDIKTLGEQGGLKVIRLIDLPYPEEAPQRNLDLPMPDTQNEIDPNAPPAPEDY